jgi:phenylalanyl-tRNA synthetase beta chain
MVCSEKELGISEESDGIIILPDDALPGTPLMDYLGDAILDVSILANTARCASILGIAREVAALTGQKVRYPDMSISADGPPISAEVAIEIGDPALNPRFTAGLIKGVAQGPSPFWIQHRLKLMGQRPINNIVDISNYVMFEIGQPTHTFAYEAIRVGPSGKKIVSTRLAQPGEKLTTLDGRSRDMQPTDILVCDELGALSVAGVMGGETSEVKADTVDVLLEVASWNPVSVRRTARHHAFSSEASFRFVRGVHPELAMLGQRRGLHLLHKFAGGTVCAGIIDVYPQPLAPVVIDLDPAYVTRLIGMAIPVETMARILESLEFGVERVGAHLRVTSPLHRLDIEGKHDLAEEIARIHGLDALPATLMNDEMAPAPGNAALDFEDATKDVLTLAGLSEIISYRMTTVDAEARLLAPGTPPDDRPYISVVNPINPDRVAMRHTLLGGLLESLAGNIRHHARVALFEIGAVYLGGEGGASVNAIDGVDEVVKLGIAMTGATGATGWQSGNKPSRDPMGFFEIKGAVDAMLTGLGAPAGTYAAVEHPTLRPGRAAAVMSGGKQIGVFGELHPRVRAQLAIDAPADQPILVGEFDMALLREAVGAAASKQIKDVPRVPAAIEDLSVVVDESVQAADLDQIIRRAGGATLSHVALFDVYRGEQIGAGKKSMSYTLTYQGTDKPLGESEIEKLRNKIIAALERQVGGAVRKG